MGKRKPLYRFFEIFPALISYAAVLLLFLLSYLNPVWGVGYVLLIVVVVFVKAIGVAFRTLNGYSIMHRALKVDWRERLVQLKNPRKYYDELKSEKHTSFGYQKHLENLRFISAAETGDYPDPDQIIHAVIVAIYNESLDVLRPTIDAVKNTAYPNKQIVMVLAYEERGGAATKETVETLQKEYKGVFLDMFPALHKEGIKNEVVGKGGNITNAGRFLAKYFRKQKVRFSDVIVTTLDSDNRPHKYYFDAVAYEYICCPDRKRRSYQPVSLFTNNIWDAPAMMRVIATGNSFWTVVSSMRPHILRNFASHSQSLDALSEMDFWSTRSITEDGHQYWRSYFYFDGNYSVLPIHLPMGQDAVLSFTFWKTLKGQFVQLRRWAYGAADIAYVATRLFSRRRNVPFGDCLMKLWRLIDSHVTWAYTALIVMFGGFIPVLFSPSARTNIAAQELPRIVSLIQTVAMIGLFVTIIMSIRMLPKRPKRYKKGKTVLMVIQWVLMPVTSIVYNSASAFYAQTRLALGLYMNKFDVTDKATKYDKMETKGG
ncbi:MAG: glycosyltransferase family 2 protein [Candidatus Nomurabacteria bacterium]|nr:glycosyltransferase family 2 protein [Candidatus Nomurabacteria bacterium]